MFLLVFLSYSFGFSSFQVPEHRVLEEMVFPGDKVTMTVEIEARLDEQTLTILAKHLRHKTGDQPQTFIIFVLPGMEPGAGGWATARFTPELKLEILGQTGSQDPATDGREVEIPVGPPEPETNTVALAGQVGVEPPTFTKKVHPVYPARALKERLEGYVILEAVLRKDGTIDDIKVLRGLGQGKYGFEEAAKAALQQWQFLPGKVNNQPADVRMTLKIDFTL